MAKLSRNFLKGRMNKDLDERLVPNGEYKDGLNISVSNAEDGQVGSVENIKGNKDIENNSFTLSSSAETIGSYVDDENNCIYNFIRSASDLVADTSYTDYSDFNKPRYTGYKSDMITRFTRNESSDSNVTESILCDVYEVRATANAFTGTIISGLANDMPLYLRPGMRVQAIDVNGNDLWGAHNDVRVVQAAWPTLIGASTGTVVITPVLDVTNIYTSSMIDDGVVLRFTDERVLNFRAGTQEIEQNHFNGAGAAVNAGAVYTPKNNIITGINVIDSLLYFTDGHDEPKKINIERGQSGGGKSTIKAPKHHTRLVISKDGVVKNMGHIKKQNITVIKPAPTKAPTAIGFSTTRDNVTSSYLYDTNNSAFALIQNDAVLSNQDTLTVISGVGNLDWRSGDIIKITGLTSSTEVDVAYVQSTDSTTHEFIIKNIPSTYTASTAPEVWLATLYQSEEIYEDKFACFAYRYKYADNEYSVISPYSKPIFIPGKYSYDPVSGFNSGMVNNLRRIKISDYIPRDIPKDVVEVELIYRATNTGADSPAYTIKKVTMLDDEWIDSISSFHKGETIINSQVFGSTLPTAQVDRLQDAVPLKAVAQEITESRLMYGNYTENYDLIDDSKNSVKASITSSIVSEDVSSLLLTNSINTLEVSQSTSLTNSYDTLIPFNLEADGGDAGNNYNTTNYYYEAPMDGDYTFEASALWVAHNKLECDTVGTNLQRFLWIYPWAKLQLVDYDSQSTVLAEGFLDIQGDFSGGGFGQFTDTAWSSGKYNPRATGDGSSDFPYWLNTAGETPPSWSNQTITLNQTVTLSQGDKVAIKIVAQDATDNSSILPSGTTTFAYTYNTTTGGQSNLDTFEWVNNTHTSTVSNGMFKCTQAPEESSTITLTGGNLSIKSQREYQLGVVYRDAYNRQSTVLMDDRSLLKIPKSDSVNVNKIKARLNNKAPYWATHYKYFIKENTGPFYNMVMSGAYDNNDSSTLAAHIWIAFNESNKDKVKIGDFIAIKKFNGQNVAATNPNYRWKVLDISKGVPMVGEGSDETALIVNAADAVGKFFVKIANDAFTVATFGTSYPKNPNPDGGLFEVEPQERQDLDIYYEVGNAYPIRLAGDAARSFIDYGAKVNLDSIFDHAWVSGEAGVYREGSVSEIKANFNSDDVKVRQVYGAKSLGAYGINSKSNESLVRIVLNKPVNIRVPEEGSVGLSFENKNGEKVTLKLAKTALNTKTLYFVPYTHSADGVNVSSSITLPWYNCVSFGNGVESESIKDEYGLTNTIFQYSSIGKASGFNINRVFDDYKQEHKKNNIIFSQIYNETSGVNRFNEFLISEGIVKQISPEYGSIQKLYTRDFDLLAFCEKKVLKILANKDELFNADGNSQLLSSTNTLGSYFGFSGDFGIGKNPESFAVDEYRIYFVDKNRSAVLRLSGDGITEISSYGMGDWFDDHLKKSQAIIGSFDQDKGEYNITLHEVTSPNYKKNVYTLSFDESVNGWTSFKSFIKEQGVSLNNTYYTFKNGKIWSHNNDTVNRNIFYAVQYNSTVTPIINESPEVVKSFSAINYEGSQSKVNQFTTVNSGGVDYTDGQYYNLVAKNGWSVENIQTDLQEGEVSEFVNKEGKWFNYISGVSSTYTNEKDGGSTSNNIDLKEFSVQGLGFPTSISGTTTGFGHKLTVAMTESGEGWESDGYVEYNVSSKTNGSTNTFIISPLPGNSISAENFTNVSANTYVNSIAFTNTGTANTPLNTVLATINWKNITLTSDVNIDVTEAGGYNDNEFTYFLELFVNRDRTKENITITDYVPGATVDSTPIVNSNAEILQTADESNYAEFSISGSTAENVPISLFKVTMTARQDYQGTTGLHYFSTGPNMTFSQNASNANAFNIVSETVVRNSNDLITSKSFIVEYNPQANISLVDQYAVYISGGVPISGFAVFNGNELIVDNSAQEVSIPFNTNVGYRQFFAETASSDISNLTVNQESKEVVFDFGSGSGNTTHTVNLFIDWNPSTTPNDSIVVRRESGNYVNVTDGDGNSTFTLLPNGGDNASLFEENGLYYFKFSVYLYTNGSAPAVAANPGFHENPISTWLNIFAVYTTSTPNVYIARVSAKINTTGATRTDTLRLMHSDASTNQSITISQQGYDSSTHTATFDVSSVSIPKEGGSGTINITAASTNNYLPVVEPISTSSFISLGNVVDLGSGSFSIDYTAGPNGSFESNSVSLNLYHPYNFTPANTSSVLTADDTITVSQAAQPYINFEPAQAIQGIITVSSSAQTNFVINVSHNDYTAGDESAADPKFLAYNSSTEAYDIDLTQSPGVSWIPHANFDWVAAVSQIDGNGKIEFDISANSTGSERSVLIGVFHSTNSTSTPNDTITIKQPAS
jgi:hypothetical protein